jgi:predicted nucleic acid-binding protein
MVLIANKLINKTIFLDTAPIIYYIEDHPKFRIKLNELFELNATGKIHFQSSVLSLLEVLILPIRKKRFDIAELYQQILSNSDNFELFEITPEIAIKSAELRARYNLKTPDAIQIATAIIKKADHFLTNDNELKKITEINILTP